MNELFPILSGLVGGIVAGRSTTAARLPIAAFVGAIVAITSTFLSGEYRIGWIYFALDAVFAIGSAVTAAMIMPHLQVGTLRPLKTPKI